MKYLWMEDIKSPKQFPKKFRDLVNKIGVKATLQFIEVHEGEEFYVNKLHDAFRDFWQARLKAEAKSKKFSVTQLAHRYGVSERHVRRIIDDPRQTALFK